MRISHVLAVAGAAIPPKLEPRARGPTAKFGRKKSPLSGGDAGFSGVFDTCRDCITVCTAVGYTGPA